MKKRLGIFFVAVLLVLKGTAAVGQGKYELPSLEPRFLPQEIFGTEDMPSKYTAEEVVELGLLYSECDLDTPSYEKSLIKYNELKAAVTNSEIMELPEQDRGRQILKIIYRDILTEYELEQTRLDVALLTGKYNCVSSAIIYMVAAKLAGLDVRGQKTTQHAFCSVYIAGKKIDVETTNPYGFNPGSKEAIEKENEIKGYYVVPKKYYSNRLELSDSLFTGLIAGNLCSFYLDKDDYVNSVPLASARYLAVRNEKSKAVTDVRKDFDILAMNFVNLMPESALTYVPQVEWYCRFIDKWGMTTNLQTKMDTTMNNLLVLCYQENDYELSCECWEKFKGYVSAKSVAQMEEIIVDTLITSSTKGFSIDKKLEFISNLYENNSAADTATSFSAASVKRIQKHLEDIWQNKLHTFMDNEDYKTGYEISAQALLQLPSSTKIKNLQKTFYNNCIAVIHNNFADKANARKNEEALEILNQGLAEFPDDKTLNRDLTTFKKMIGE